MPDISMCDNNDCALRKTCYRFVAIPNLYLQVYGLFTPVITKEGKTECEYYWKTMETLNKNKNDQ